MKAESRAEAAYIAYTATRVRAGFFQPLNGDSLNHSIIQRTPHPAAGASALSRMERALIFTGGPGSHGLRRGLKSIGPPGLVLTQCALSLNSRAPCRHQTSDQLIPRGGNKAQRYAAVLSRGAHCGVTLKRAGRQHFGQFLLHIPKSLKRPAGHAAFAAVGQQFMLGKNHVRNLHRKTVR